jgi:hypothetical protein
MRYFQQMAAEKATMILPGPQHSQRLATPEGGGYVWEVAAPTLRSPRLLYAPSQPAN